MKGAETFIGDYSAGSGSAPGATSRRARQPPRQPVEIEVNHRRRVKRQQLAEDQAADDRDAEGPPQFRARARAECERHARQQRRHRSHHDGPEAQKACLVDRVNRSHALLPLGLEREIDHHDGVLLDDADQQDDPDQRNHAEIVAAEYQRQQGAYAGRRQGGQDRDGVNVAFVQDPEHDVDSDESGQDQHRLVRQRGLERFGGSLKLRLECSAGIPISCLTRFTAFTASPSDAPGARLNERVTTGNWPW